jgi:hypothetical protein
MEFMSRGVRQVVGGQSGEGHSESRKKSSGKSQRVLSFVLLLAVAVLIIAMSIYLAFGGVKK